MSDIIAILNTYTFQIVALGTGILGVLTGIIGSYVTLRKESLLGDALGHASLPGVVLAFMITGERDLRILILGAAATGLLATFIIQWMVNKSPVKLDSALAINLASFFGLGTVLLTYVQRDPSSQQAGLDNFIFGQASGMLQSDVRLIALTGIILLALVLIFWKEFKLITFDRPFSQTLSGPYKSLEVLLNVMIVVTIVLGIQSVGVILISAMLVIPSITARQWTYRLPVLMVLSGTLGAISAVVGTLFSSMGRRIPTGPSIVVVASIFAIVSLLIAPNRGILARNRERRVKQKQLLLYDLEGRGK